VAGSYEDGNEPSKKNHEHLGDQQLLVKNFPPDR